MKAPHHALVYAEVGTLVLEMGEQDKAYELFVLAGSFALSKVIDHPAPIIKGEYDAV